MFFQFSNLNKFLVGALIAVAVFFGLPVFAEEEISPAEISAVAEIVTGDAPQINTGQAISLSDTVSEVNTNETEQEVSSTNNETSVENPAGIVLETDVSNENEAVVENNVATVAETGNNNASGGDGGSNGEASGATITTGDSLASANVVNVVNTNIFNSAGFFFILSALFGQIGTIDLREAMMTNTSSSTPSLTSLCASNLCNATTTSITNIENINTAEITNDVVVRSSTGNNSANGDGSIINTGNAYAAANVVNVVNTNIIDSNYALMIFNNFGGWGGDFILPNKDFFDNFFLKKNRGGNNGAGTSALSISNQNSADVNNNVTTAADTGGNETTGDGNEITTGDAAADSSVQNVVNTNLLGGQSLRILFRITGNWGGKIFGLPAGVHWRQTEQGVELFGDDLIGNDETNPASNEARNLSNTDPTASTTVSITNNNAVTINNNVQVYALTGENKIEGDNSEISTGDAAAAANVVNLANTNVVGQNWLYAIFNIFGDWNGNIAFGQPDLWLGARAESLSGGFGPGARVAYHFTIANRGDADASGVKLKNVFDNNLIRFGVGVGPEKEWEIGMIPAGQSIEITEEALIDGNIPFGDTELLGDSSVISFEKDANAADNADRVVIIASRVPPSPVYQGLNVPLTPDPILSVEKTNDVSTTTPLTASSTVKYKVVIKNDGGEAYRSVLVDTLKNEKGEIINEQSWDLDIIFPGEEITVDYAVFFNASTTDGIYTNYAQVKALGRHPSLDPFYGWFADSNVASSSISIAIANPKPEPAPEPWVYLSPPDPSYVPPTLQTEEIKREIKPIIKPAKETNVFPPLQSFEPFDSDFFGKMVFVSRPSYDLNQTAAVFAGLPFVNIPRNLNLLFLLIIGTALASSQRAPIRKFRRAFTSFLS